MSPGRATPPRGEGVLARNVRVARLEGEAAPLSGPNVCLVHIRNIDE
jgi:hypothetical protein